MESKADYIKKSYEHAMRVLYDEAVRRKNPVFTKGEAKEIIMTKAPFPLPRNIKLEGILESFEKGRLVQCNRQEEFPHDIKRIKVLACPYTD